MKKIILIITFLNLIIAQNFTPENASILNYTQILFRWPQINGSESYELYINGESDNSYNSFRNSIIINDFSWGAEYVWSVCGFDDSGELIDCYEDKAFTVNNLPANYPNNTSIYAVSESEYSPGVTMLDFDGLNFSVALDIDGNPIWFADKDNFSSSKILVTQFLPSGNIVGFGGGKGYEFDINSNIIFETPNNLGVHHHIHKTHNGTYFLLDQETEIHPCPVECNPNLDIEIPWKGDKLIEVDQNGNILWEWNTFDYLSLNEYNPMWISGGGELDWTHSNSVYFEELSNLVYVSIRNLSRITAIDYSTKEIVWSLGDPEYMDNIYFENDFSFSHQHSAQITYDNNLLFFDNGRGNSPELSRCLEIDFSNNNEPNLVWEYTLPDSLLTLSRGECDRLSNNNALISAGRTGNVIELNEEDEIIWHFNAKNNTTQIGVYRSERIHDLYPTVFSFEVNNLSGVYGNYILLDNDVSFNIYNNGWDSQYFSYQIFNIYDQILNEGEVSIESSSETSIQIENLNNGYEIIRWKNF